MTKKILKYLFPALLLTLFVSCASSKNTNFTINCEIEGLEEGTVMELKPGGTHKEEKSIATAIVKDGKFKFSDTLQDIRLFYIVATGENTYGSIPVMTEAGKIKVIAKATKRTDGDRKMYDFSDVSVLGSPSHELYIAKIAPKDFLNSLYEEYHAKAKEITDQISAARMAKDEKKLKELYATEAWKTFEQDEKHFFDTVTVTMTKMVLDNANSWWGPFLMLNQMSYFTKEQEAWWGKFSDEAKNSYYGKIVSEELFPVGFAGKNAPEFKVINDKNEEVALAELLAGKKYILLDFWASWCKPCRNEIPNFKKAYETFSSKGFGIVSISTDKSAADWQKALKEEQLPWPNFMDKSDIAGLYKVKLIPTTFLIDEKGIVVAENLRGEALQNKLKELLP